MMNVALAGSMLWNMYVEHGVLMLVSAILLYRIVCALQVWMKYAILVVIIV